MPAFYYGRKVLITGHTGFKGSWLSFWLQELGAKVCGYSTPAPTEPSHWSLLNTKIKSVIGDVRDYEKVKEVFNAFEPEIVFHLAAQPLVIPSYSEPIETYSTNVMGTLNVFEACRKTDSVRAIVNITSDKCYENRELDRGYREEDILGGYDPYSSSKSCSEILTASYRNSYFNNERFGNKHQTLLASCRAGNVIGGGDWAQYRIVPDIMKAAAKRMPVEIRNPKAVRPWQHVLEPLSGYLLVGRRLLEGHREFATAWNFGPCDTDCVPVSVLAANAKQSWNNVNFQYASIEEAAHETHFLKLDCSKSHKLLGWKPIWNFQKALEKTVCWYKNFYENQTLNTKFDLDNYLRDIDKDWGLNC